jgi:DNA-3-methyladenine glycosylase II
MAQLTLPVSAPFDLLTTVRLLQRRPNNRIDVWTGEAYARALVIDGTAFACTSRLAGERLQVEVVPPPSRSAREAISRTLTRVLGLDVPPGFSVPGTSANPKLRSLAKTLRGARPPRFPTLFESFCRIIPYQQLSLEAGSAVTSRFAERFARIVDSGAGPLIAFPEAERLARARIAEFEGIGLSRTKVASIKALARLISRGELREDELASLGTGAALERLQRLPGIGPWTAAVVLLRGMRRLDVFPEGDVGAQRGLGELVGAPARVRRLIEQAGPRRGYLYFYALANGLRKRGLLGR